MTDQGCGRDTWLGLEEEAAVRVAPECPGETSVWPLDAQEQVTCPKNRCAIAVFPDLAVGL